jgi:hypothetical protein
MLQERRRTVVLFTHSHSLESMRFVLPPHMRIVERVSFHRGNGVIGFDVLTGETPWGLCDLVVIENYAKN